MGQFLRSDPEKREMRNEADLNSIFDVGQGVFNVSRDYYTVWPLGIGVCGLRDDSAHLSHG